MQEVELADHAAGKRALLDSTVQLRWHIEKMEARLVENVAEIDRRRAFEEDGAVTIVGWLKSRCRMDTSRAGQLAKLAQAGEAFPELRQAHLDGRVSSCEARRVLQGASIYQRDLERHNVEGEESAQAMAEVRRRLLAAAESGEGPDRLRREIDSHRHQLAADALAVDEWAMFRQRTLHLYTTFDGMVDLRGTLDPSSAATVRTALESLTTPSRDGAEVTAGQARADALVQLAKNALDSGYLPKRQGQRPHLRVTVNDCTLNATADAAGTEPADLHRHGAISAETARLVACDADITRIVQGAESEILDVGRTTRVVPRGIRKALSIRNGGCAYPQCDRPLEWCDAHHIKHWAHGGATRLDNLVMLCRRHHTEVHLTGARIERKDGILHVNVPQRGLRSSGEPSAPP